MILVRYSSVYVIQLMPSQFSSELEDRLVQLCNVVSLSRRLVHQRTCFVSLCFVLQEKLHALEVALRGRNELVTTTAIQSK